MTEGGADPEWRAKEIGRLYDRIGAIRDYRIQVIRELENTGQNERLQRILDETQAVIDALTDKIEFFIEHGAAWFEHVADSREARDIRARLWRCLEAQERRIERWEREHKGRPVPELERELKALHTGFRRDLSELERVLE
jgi:hypothetical protein